MGKLRAAAPLPLHEFQQGFLPLIAGIVLAIALSFTIRETGSAQGKRSEVELPQFHRA